MKVGDGAFVKCDHNHWRYGVVIFRGFRRPQSSLEQFFSGPNAHKLECIIFQMSKDGTHNNLIFINSREHDWSPFSHIRPIKKDHISYHPSGTTPMAIPGEPSLVGIKLQPPPFDRDITIQKLRRERAKEQSLVIASSYRDQWLQYDPQGDLLTLTPEQERNEWIDINLGTRYIQIRSPVPGAFYTKFECLIIILNTTVKGSRERGELVKFLVKHQFVPNQKGLYSLLNKFDNLDIVRTTDKSLRNTLDLDSKDNNWGMTKEENLLQEKGKKIRRLHMHGTYRDSEFEAYFPEHKRNDNTKCSGRLPPVSHKLYDIGYTDGNFGKFSKEGSRGWFGRLRLYIIPVTFSQMYKLDRNGTLCDSTTEDDLLLCVNIINYIGSTKLEGEEKNNINERDCRLYLPPSMFPPPNHLHTGGSSDTFQKLKSFIELVSEREGSPVTCSTGTSKTKVFTCRYRKSGGKTVCPFSVSVGWDKHGYFIHLLSSPKWPPKTCGCPFHCCKDTSMHYADEERLLEFRNSNANFKWAPARGGF